jgi:hypothetical protein
MDKREKRTESEENTRDGEATRAEREARMGTSGKDEAMRIGEGVMAATGRERGPCTISGKPAA